MKSEGKMNSTSNPSDAEIYANVAFSALITTITIPSNLIILVIFWRYKRLRDLNNTAITMLSGTDFLRGCIVMTTKIHNQLAFAKEMHYFMCHLTAVICAFSFVFSPLVLALIAFVRYHIIVPRTQRFGKLTMKKFNIIRLVLFLVAFLFSMLPYMGVGDYAYSAAHGVCFADWRDINRVYRIIFYMLVIGIAFPVLTVSYTKLFFALHGHSKNFTRSATSDDYSGVDLTNEMSAEYQSRNYSEKTESAGSNRRSYRCSAFNDAKDGTADNKDVDTKMNFVEQQKESNKETDMSKGDVAVIIRGDTSRDIPSPTTSNKSKVSKHNSIVRNLSKQEYQVTKLLILIFIAYCVCWIPAAVVNVVALTHINRIPKIWFFIIVTMVELKSAIDPLIYGLGNRKYRIAFMKLMRTLRRKFTRYTLT